MCVYMASSCLLAYTHAGTLVRFGTYLEVELYRALIARQVNLNKIDWLAFIIQSFTPKLIT